MQDARALLDSLMGPSRDKNLEEQNAGEDWKDKNVCKRFLVGFCPTNAQDNWFHNTRRKDVVVCTKVHSERLREDFEKHPQHERQRVEYEREFLGYLEGLVREADAWIARETANCRESGTMLKMTTNTWQKMKDMEERAEQMLKQAEELADQGNLAASKTTVESAQRMKVEAKEMKDQHTFQSQGEKVCDICGVRCNPDEPADYKAHMDGRLHAGYTQIRAKVKELREKLRHLDFDRKPSKEDAAREKDKDRDKDRDRRRDSDRGGDRGERGREKGRDDRHGDRDRDRRRSRSRERRRR